MLTDIGGIIGGVVAAVVAVVVIIIISVVVVYVLRRNRPVIPDARVRLPVCKTVIM